MTNLPAFKDSDRNGRINYAGPVLAGGRIILASSDGRVLSLEPSNGDLIETVDIDDRLMSRLWSQTARFIF